MDVLDQKLGPEADVAVSISTGGALVVVLSYKGAEASASVTASVSADALLAALEAKIDSTFGKEAIELLRGALKAIPA